MSDNSDDDNHRDNHNQSIIRYMNKRDYEMVIIFMVRIISSVLILPVLVMLMKVD